MIDTTTEEETLTSENTGVAGEFQGGDVLDTPTLSLPKQQAEIHHGTVVSVTEKTSEETGNSYGIITLQSKETGLTFDYLFFPPQAWFDPANWGTTGFNPEVLSADPVPGKKLSPQQLFAMNVASTEAAYNKETGAVITEPVPGKDAPLQLLKKLAAIEGFTLDAGTPRPTSGTEYIATVNALVAGRLDVIFTRRPAANKANPQFDGALKVNAIFPKQIEEQANFTKRFSTYRVMWEQ